MTFTKGRKWPKTRIINPTLPKLDYFIAGQAGVDFPVLASVPDTGFDCGAQEFPGIYGDTGADCQVCISYVFEYMITYFEFIGLLHVPTQWKL